MKLLKTIQAKFHTFFFAEDTTKGTFLAFFRIGTSAFVLIHLLSIILDFKKLYSKNGIIPYDIREFLASDYKIAIHKIINFFESFGLQEDTIITGFLVVFIGALLALMSGLLTRLSAIIVLFLYGSISSTTYIYGVDGFVTTALFYMVIFPVGYFNSVDNILFKNRKRGNLHVTLFKRLLQINLCIVYFFGGVVKMVGETWWNGEAIWKAMNLWSANTLFDFDYTWLAENSYLLVIIGWSVLAIEALYPIFIWSKKTRKIWLTGTLLMHIGIGLLLDLYFFAAFMMFWNVAAFYIDKPLNVKELLPGFSFSKRKETIPQNAPVEA
jgi:hypothetical protein